MYDPDALCTAAANIMVLSISGTTTNMAMKCAGFKSITEEYGIYRKRIERLRDKLKSEHPASVMVNEGSIESASTLSCLTTSTLGCSTETVSKSVGCILLL